MDESLLSGKGYHPTAPVFGYAEGYTLKIGERATLARAPGQRAHGAIMSLSKGELNTLYGESSVADYQPEEIVITTSQNESLKVTVYNLPVNKLTGKNKHYAQQLAKVASELGLPKENVEEIKGLAV